MTKSARIMIHALFACWLATAAVAADSIPATDAAPAAPPAVEGRTPSLLTGAPLNLLPPSQKAAEPSDVLKTVRLGYVDLMKINSESRAGKAGQKQLDDKKKKLQGQVENRRKQIEKMKTSIETKLQTMTPQQREAKGREFQKKIEEFQKFGQNAENELQTLQQSLISSLYEKIERACAEYGKANGLALVVVKRELLYLASGVESIDITDGIVKLLDEQEQKK